MLTATDIAPRRLGGCRVLVVESEGDSAACLTAMLRLNGFDARAIFSGADALRELPVMKPAAMILDLDLPDMDACEVIRKVRSRTNPAACPVVVITAHSGQSHRNAALAAGASNYLLKPTEPLTLVRALMELCAGG